MTAFTQSGKGKKVVKHMAITPVKNPQINPRILSLVNLTDKTPLQIHIDDTPDQDGHA